MIYILGTIVMEPEEFNGKLGRLVQASIGAYSTFEPKPLPLNLKYDEELAMLLEQAALSLGNLSAMGKQLRNPHLLISPYMKKEAVLSSKIEGTRTSLSEVFLHEKKAKESENYDLREVLNYIKALEYGLKAVKETPITEELIKNMHRILLKGTRGEDKNPGEYKNRQNWIGSSEDILEAKFVPASPETTPSLMENLFKYINENSGNTPLVKAGLMHYQFETIHPFRDGNGRLGRLLVILYLCSAKILSQPLLYPSAYFEKNRAEYNNRLFEASSKAKIESWLKFFLKAINVQSKEAFEKTARLEDYHEKSKLLIEEKTNSLKALRILEGLFENPYITYSEVMVLLKCNRLTAKRNLDVLAGLGILKEFEKGTKKSKIFYAPKIKEILEK
jgi:Fic family protein